MEHFIKNDILQLSVKQIGAELCSIKAVATGREYMWDASPEIWGSHSPVLFPIIGRLKNDNFIYNGHPYFMPGHGFVRGNSDIKLESKSESCLSFTLQNSNETFKMYPFVFQFVVQYFLENRKITVRFIITNTGNDRMFFSVGGHPAFKCPLNENEKYSDYFLEFEKNENSLCWGPIENGLIGHETRTVIENGKTIYLNEHTFDQGALVFKDLKSRKVSLMNKKSGPVLNAKYQDFPYLGIWAKPNAHFVCIEPWHGIADSWDADGKIETKEGIIALDAGNTFETSYSIEILI